MEHVVYRTEVGYPLSYSTIDGNFKYLTNPWSEDRIYDIDMIVYHDIVPNKYNFYIASTTTTVGTFLLEEWDVIGSLVFNVIDTAYTTLIDFIDNQWTSILLNIGDYIRFDDKLYLLYQNTGDSINDYLFIGYTTTNNSSFSTIVISAEMSLQNYIDNQWVLNSIKIGDLLLLGNNEVWTLYSGTGATTVNYIKLSNDVNINWTSITGKPTSTSSQIDTSVSRSHIQNSDLYLNYGGLNQVSAADLKSHINDTTIHFTQELIDHTAIQNIGHYTHVEIDDFIDALIANPVDSTLVDHLQIQHRGTNTHTQIDTHIGTATVTHAQIDTHIIGLVNTHTQIDSHIADTTIIHYTQDLIDHRVILYRGTNTHTQIDSHIADTTTIHYTQDLIDHTAIQNIGTNTHNQIDTHIATHEIHLTAQEITDSISTNLVIIPSEGINSGMMHNNNIVSGDNSIAFGSNNIISTDSTNCVIVGGTDNTINNTLTNSIVLGGNNIVATQSNRVYSTTLEVTTGYFINGNLEIFELSTETTDAMEHSINTNSILNVNTATSLRIDICAFCLNLNLAKMWEVRGVFKNVGNNITMVGDDLSIFVTTEDPWTDIWDVNVIADNVNKSFIINITGDFSVAINWRATCYITKNI